MIISLFCWNFPIAPISLRAKDSLTRCPKSLFSLTNSPLIAHLLLLLNHPIPAVLASCFFLEYSGTLLQKVLYSDCSSSWNMFPRYPYYLLKVFLKCSLLNEAYCDLFKLITPPFPISYVWYSFPVYFSPNHITPLHSLCNLLTYFCFVYYLPPLLECKLDEVRNFVLFFNFCVLITLNSSWQIVKGG